jgi:hypothetical protein
MLRVEIGAFGAATYDDGREDHDALLAFSDETIERAPGVESGDAGRRAADLRSGKRCESCIDGNAP